MPTPFHKHTDTLVDNHARPAASGNAARNSVNCIHTNDDTLSGNKHKYGARVLTLKPAPIAAPDRKGVWGVAPIGSPQAAPQQKGCTYTQLRNRAEETTGEVFS